MSKKMYFVYGLILLFVMILVVGMPVEAKKRVALNKKEVILKTEKSVTLKVKNTKKKVTWHSSKKTVAAVSKRGRVTAKKAGIATITAKIGKKCYTCKVTVKSKEADKPLVYHNAIFTKEDFMKHLYVISNGKIVLDETGASEIYRLFASLKELREWSNEEIQNAQEEVKNGKVGGVWDSCGGVHLSFVYKNGDVVKLVLHSSDLVIDGKYYHIERDMMGEVENLVKQYGTDITKIG